MCVLFKDKRLSCFVVFGWEREGGKGGGKILGGAFKDLLEGL